MTLLQEIQNAAVDASTDLSTVLRKCSILAARLKNKEFKDWVKHELDGYPQGTDLPEYRKIRTQSYGHFVGPLGTEMKNGPIPLRCIPEEFHEIVSSAEFRGGVSELQALIASSPGGILREMWPADLVALVASRIYERLNLAMAWKVVPTSVVVGVLDSIRNRVLGFVLEIESAAPAAGEDGTSTALPPERVASVFNTYITGNVGNIASGGTHFTQQSVLPVTKGDWESLEEYLKSLGIEGSDLSDLKEAISDKASGSGDRFSKKVASWFGRMISKSAEGVWRVSTDVAANLLSKALAQYLGLPNS